MKIIPVLFLVFLLSGQISANEGKMKNVLIVYGSFSGSTKEVAEKMKSTLEKNKLRVDAMAADANKMDLKKYDLVIIGSAIRGDTPHEKVLGFVKANKEELEKKKVALFIVCITITSKYDEKRKNAEKYPGKIAGGLTPVSTAVFAGNAPSSGWFANIMGNLFLGIKPGDFRDWDKINEWVISLLKL